MKKITLMLFLFLIHLGSYAQLASEGFESTAFPPTGWDRITSVNSTFGWGRVTYPAVLGSVPAHSGNAYASINLDPPSNPNDPTTFPENWLITKAFAMPTNGQLHFFSVFETDGDQGSTLKVMITKVTTGTPVATDFVPLQTYTETQLNAVQTQWTENIITINGTTYPPGTQVRLAFVKLNSATGGDRWSIDDVSVTEQCAAPTNLAANPSGTSAVLSWTNTSSATSWEVYVVPTGTAAPAGTVAGSNTANSTTYTKTGLTPTTNYQYYVRSMCTGNPSTWTGPFAFTTTQIPGTIPYTDDFEASTDAVPIWSLDTATNQWKISDAVNNGGQNSLYISNNGTYTYNATTTVNGVHAYRDIQMPAVVDQLTLTFDWRGIAQNNTTSDYFRVWVVPATFIPTGNVQLTAANSGGTQIGGNFANNLNWKTESLIINAAAFSGKVMRLVFEWHNDNVLGTKGDPAAIDNVNLKVVTCPSPTAVTATLVGGTSATISWTVPTSVNPSYNYYYSTTNTPPNATTTPSGTVLSPNNSVTLTGLTPLTPYFFWVRSNCGGASGAGIWVALPSFTTAIGNDDCSGATTLPVNLTDACTATTKAVFTGANATTALPACKGVNGPDIWFKFTATQSKHDISLADFTPNGWWGGTQANAQNIVLSLYDGTCGSLSTPLFCKDNNYMQAQDLTPGTVYLVRATINNATPNLATTFNICVSTPPAPSATNQSNCIITTINPSFESPNKNYATVGTTVGKTNSTLNQNVVQGWRTTATDNLIEFWPIPAAVGGFNNVDYKVETAANGNTSGWFIELNAESVSNVYQEYSTPSQTVFKCSFAHRGRWGVDKCKLMAGPPGGPYTTIAEAETGPDAWKYYGTTPGQEITYVVPSGQPVTWFIFEAVSSTGDSTGKVGNFLDDVVFTADNSILSVSEKALDCITKTTTFTAAGSGVWTAQAGNPATVQISNPNNNVTNVTNFTAPGTYKFDWTTAYCTSTTEVTYAAANIDLPTVSPKIYCEGEVAPRLEATTTDPLYLLKWYTVATGGTALAGPPVPNTEKVGDTKYYVSQITGDCEGLRAEVVVTVNPRPIAPTPDPVAIYCKASTAAPVSATVTPGSGNTLVWYNSATDGADKALPGAPTPSTAKAGPITYWVSQKSPEGCESPRVAVEVTVRDIVPAFADFTVPATVCIAATNNPVPTPSLTFTTGGTYSYTVATGTGTLTIDPVTGEIDLATSTPGSYNIVYTIAGDPANCFLSNTTSQPIVINPISPAVVAFSYTDVCSNGANQLPQPTAAPLTPGGTFTYTGTGTLAINPTTGEINVGASTQGTYTITYTVATDTPNCVTANSDSATITITPYIAPVTDFTYDAAYCYGIATATPTLATGFSAGGVFTVTGGLTINPATGEITNLTNATGGQYTVTYTYTGNGSACNPNKTSEFTFTIGSESIFTLTAECVNGAFTVTGTPTNGSYNPDDVSYAWTIGGTSVGTDSKDFNYADYARNNPGVKLPVKLTLTVTNGSCPTSQDFDITDASCDIQRGISPGGNDQLNNYFDLAQLGVRKLSIFNRYGKEVYTKNNYTIEWHGQTNDGDELPTGAYFYAIDLNVGKTKTGWIYINRQN